MPPVETAQAHESKLYSELSYLYDIVFTRIFCDRIQATIRSLNIEPSAKILEVGVGTGLSFEAYPSHCQVTGIDLAPDMLDKARDKISRNGWRHLRVLEMDALNMKFEDNFFDYAMAFHVVSVVPDAERLMREVTRVTKPGARIIIINHFRSRNRVLAFLDRLMEPITRKLGWHTLSLEQVISGVPFKAEKVYKTGRRSLFTIVVGRNTK
ncbi:MAG: class I SAM-dependent methyltransferase [Deltaproteobacteria bacterium]|nr:class I SAM-dependent methyltransferase [Deltaproteobacteria bacterium]